MSTWHVFLLLGNCLDFSRYFPVFCIGHPIAAQVFSYKLFHIWAHLLWICSRCSCPARHLTSPFSPPLSTQSQTIGFLSFSFLRTRKYFTDSWQVPTTPLPRVCRPRCRSINLWRAIASDTSVPSSLAPQIFHKTRKPKHCQLFGVWKCIFYGHTHWAYGKLSYL